MPTCVGVHCDLCLEMACECDIIVVDNELNLCPVCCYKLGIPTDSHQEQSA